MNEQEWTDAISPHCLVVEWHYRGDAALAELDRTEEEDAIHDIEWLPVLLRRQAI